MIYPVVLLRKGKERALIMRHPWLFSGAIQHVKGKAKEGDIVEIHSDKGETLGFGFYNPESQIRVKLFQSGNEVRVFDDAYWMSKFHQAYTLRKAVINPDLTNGYRLFHAEGDFLPGIITDIYAKTASVQIRTKGAEPLIPLLVKFLTETAGCTSVYHKKEEKEGVWLQGNETGATEFMENGIRFWVDVVNGQKTGFFLDQRDNREKVKQFCKEKTVLNAFSYTGGFSVYAQAGGAKKVVSLDISATATDACKQNMDLNFPDSHHEIITADCFRYLKEMPEGEYDCIILDPPAFSKHISTVDNAARGYKEINLKAFQKIKHNGILFTFSCSQHIDRDLFQKIVFGAAADAKRNIRILAHLSQGADHPVDICHREGEYLKGLILWVD
ncbi:MAG: class I SAM-dependent rRNA methyltransferase [Bacteroidia bacterium]|nr:class I SAM-dependent rRNA methyltransferase [Bacteroidia bacterium]